MFKRFCSFLLSICLILGVVQAVNAESDSDLYEKLDQLWAEYGDRDFHDQAYENLYFAVIDQVGGPDTADWEQHPSWLRALFIVMILDMEIQNGGLAQFFWNNGSAYASLVPDALDETGLQDVKKLYEDFVRENGITMAEIDALREEDPTMTDIYSKHPFDDFDYAYMRIWAETDINGRLLDYAAEYPAIFVQEGKADESPAKLPGILTEQKMEMTDEEVVRALRDAGIDVSDATARETRQNMDALDAYYKGLGFTPYQRGARDYAASLLTAIGMGDYDYAADTWTPTSADVYAFDAEVFDISRMYALFLQGVQSIVPGFEVQDVKETVTEYKVLSALYRLFPMAGFRSEGSTAVSFTLNGHRYEKQLAYYGDWFDEKAIDWINEVLEKEGFEGRLYSFYDGGQGLILIYGSPEKAAKVGRLLD